MSLEELPRMMFHLFEASSWDADICGRCGGVIQQHPSPEAHAEWLAEQEPPC